MSKEELGCNGSTRRTAARSRILVEALLALLLPAWTLSATAAPLKPAQKHVMAEKYSDVGAKPASNRAGSAQLSARALLGSQGDTRIELSTGDFEGGPTTGTLDKVQVKIFRDDKLAATDNYNQLGNATATLGYTSLVRGQKVALQANVKTGGRTGVVSLDTTVMRRPDVAAVEVAGPDQVPVGATRAITGIVREMNGDIGARFDCQLFVDDVLQGTIHAAWVDAGSQVACQFMAKFSTAGTSRVSVRVSNMAPADDNTADDAAVALVDVVALPFDTAEGYYQWSRIDGANKYHWFFYMMNFPPEDVYTGPATYTYWFQRFGADATMYSEYPAVGTVRLKHSMDGQALPDVEVDLAQLVPNDVGCLSNLFEGGVVAYLCQGAGYFNVGAYVSGNIVIYTVDGWYGAQPSFLNGENYHVEISVESPDLQRRSAMDVHVPPQQVYGSADWSPWSCVSTYDDYLTSINGTCISHWETTTERWGYATTP